MSRAQELMDELRNATGATRTTLRSAERDYAVIAESLAEGARSLSKDSPIDPRTGATFDHLVRNDSFLIQEDAAAHEFAPPQQLRDYYGVEAQMLAPLRRDGDLVGIVSVHSNEKRPWTEADIAALERAAEEATSLVTTGGRTA